MAETESPPPMMEMADLLAATALAMALVPTANRGNSKTPAGPFQTMVLAVATTVFNCRDGVGTDVQALPVGGEVDSGIPELGFGVGGEAVGEDVIDGEQKLDALGFGLVESGFGHIDLVFFDQ